MKKLILSLIRFYQRHLNIDNPVIKGLFLSDRVCRFSPTCSQYCYQAVERYGILKGSFRCLQRIIRCHPWSKGGWDPLR